MKDLIIDLCLVGLLLFFINALFNDHNIEKQLFNRNVQEYNQVIEDNQVITSDYGSYDDNEENSIALFVKKISDGCIKIIEIIVLIISNIISTLL